ncbi:MAG TPA: hypothetical protein PK360_08390 [bacterium]|nr:hypothetical protein [bacterium]
MAEASAPTTGTQPALTEPFEIGGVEISNRVLLAPLASIGNWFVRLQARRYGAGLAVSGHQPAPGCLHKAKGSAAALPPGEHRSSLPQINL